jgi:hypothetical protein
MEAFSLTKWYLDCVDPGGRTAIVYWTSLAWRGISLTWHHLTRHDPGVAPWQRSSLARVAPPEWRNGELAWRSGRMGCHVRCVPRTAPFSARLFESPDGSLDWHCEAAISDVRIEMEDQSPLSGLGYAERLVLSLPPWRLPMDELMWGRWISNSAMRSCVWIAWRGDHPMEAVFLDGRRTLDAEVSDDRILVGGDVLTLANRRTLHARSLGDLVRPVRPLAALLPSSWLHVQDVKWFSTGRLQSGGIPPEDGFAIHERVVFP